METTEEKRTFTPGPWKVSSHQTQIHSERYGLVAALQRFTEKSTTHANARLIAAAPEMLEQCKLFEKVLKAIGDMGYKDEIDLDSHSWLMRTMELREVLAKVDGGEG
jgi:hypothetical protein